MKTALITGASGGIGLEFSKILAQRGVNLVLVARSKNRLEEVASELIAKYKIHVECLAVDLSSPSNAELIYERLKGEGKVFDFVINNAGFGIDDSFTAIPWEKEQEMLNLNMITLSFFTKKYALDMSVRGEGHILNVSSIGAFQPGPFMAGYCATKAYVLSLSEAVNYELRGSGVTVTALCPGVTDTGFHQRANTLKVGMNKYLSHATPQQVAAYGYRIMMKGKSYGVYGVLNRLIVFSNRLICRRLITAMSAQFMS